jgi:hypothetical protein
MSDRPVIVEGTLRPDGTLELDGKVDLPPGRVQVIVQPLPALPGDDPFWQRMEGIWRGQRERGHLPRSSGEVEAERRALNEEMSREVDRG